ncbi:MAG: PAS domain-containing protein [Magnetococcales bacterium]|nr:PAS domain-containing protein [Magnetococcales bacterium]
MKRRSNKKSQQELRDGVLGLGQKSMRKSYYSQLRRRMDELEQYRGLLNQARDAICLVDMDSLSLVDCNDGAKKMFQLHSDKDTPPPTLLEIIGENHEKIITEWLSQSDEAKNDSLEIEAERTLAGGEHIFILLSLSRAVFADIKHIVCVGHDITARRNAEIALQNSHAELENRVKERTRELAHSNKELEAFAYSVSHDLRAPLRSIEGFGQILLDDYHGKMDDEGKQYIKYMQEGCLEMNALIDGILALSRSTRGEIHIEELDLSSLAQNIVQTLHNTEPERKVTTAIMPGLTCKGDSRLIKTCLENLLGNAWKYSSKKPHTQIDFGTKEEDGETIYYIQDNGDGFDMNSVERLFQPFKRLHTNSQFEGNGIGLATVKRIIERHGGRIWAKGEVGIGATFNFTLLAAAKKS